MLLSLLGQVALSVLVSAFTPTPTLTGRTFNEPLPPSQFVTTKNGQFFFNGSSLTVIGTNAYWLPVLNADEDIDFALGSIKAAGINTIRVWAFNDVQTIPENGTWFQLIANGTTTINNGTNGLQKLDTVVQLAEKHGVFLQLSLTNNWNPLPLLDNITTSFSPINARDVTNGTNNTLARNTLSNDYGGMDAYVRVFSNSTTMSHDDFYTNPTILDAFMNYTTQIVSRYVNSPAIIGWELANDPRCNSTVPTSAQCTTNTVTLWHSQVAQHVRSVDPNHLIASGNQGFFCMDCPKLFPRIAPQASPSPSPAPSVRRRLAKRLTKKRLLQERKAALKKSRSTEKRSESGPSIRARWIAPATKRQFDQGVGSAFDGSSGVDSEDIINIPQIGYGTFQLFPDQNKYGPDDPSLPAFNNTVQQGLQWIQQHAELGQLFGKPVSLTGFGLVTQNNAPFFVPFNTTQAPFGSDQGAANATPVSQPFGVTDQQRDDAYLQWLEAGLKGGLSGMFQYQWSLVNLTTGAGTAIQPAVNGTDVGPIVTGTGVTPNDGYGIQGVGQQDVMSIIQQVAQASGPDTPAR